MLSVLKLNLTFNQKCIKIDLKNFQEPNWDEIIEEQKLEDDINKCREVLPVILYLAGYCCYAVFKNIKCNSCKDLISGRDNMEEIPEINSYFQRINRGSLLYPYDITTNFLLYNYVVIDKLIKNNSFLHSLNQRKLESVGPTLLFSFVTLDYTPLQLRIGPACFQRSQIPKNRKPPYRRSGDRRATKWGIFSLVFQGFSFLSLSCFSPIPST